MLVFFSFVLLFMLLLLPVYHYTEDMAHQAEVRRCETRLQNGILSLESSITALHNMGQSLTSDTMFLSMLRLNKEETPDVFNLIRMGRFSHFDTAGSRSGADYPGGCFVYKRAVFLFQPLFILFFIYAVW